MSEKIRSQIREAMERQDMSQRELARRSGSYSSHVNKYLRGGDITTTTLETWCRVLGIDAIETKQDG